MSNQYCLEKLVEYCSLMSLSSKYTVKLSIYVDVTVYLNKFIFIKSSDPFNSCWYVITWVINTIMGILLFKLTLNV